MRPLEGIRVLDFTHALSGPTSTNMLAMLGASVTKVERCDGGDDFRHYTEHAGLPGMSIPFAAANAGKASITLDLKAPESREVINRLIDRSDVMVENFRPGTMAKLGLDEATVRQRNPRIVYCSITGFGQTGRLRDWTAYDNIVQAICGMSLANGDTDGSPRLVPLPIIDIFSGYMGVIGVLAALQRRTVSGEGDAIDVSMIESALKLMSTAVTHYFEDGTLPVSRRNRGFRLVATSDTYKTADGYLAIAANHQHQIRALFDVLGHPEMIDDPRFCDHAARGKNFTELRDWLIATLAGKSAEELEGKLARLSVPVAKVRTLGEIAEHPLLAERRPFRSATLADSGRSATVMGPGIHFASGMDPDHAGTVPALGNDTDAVLLDLDFSPAEIALLRAAEAV